MADEGKDTAGQESGLRTGGNMQTRGGQRVPATPPPPLKDGDTRTGGNMQTKGASGGHSADQPAEGTSETPTGQSE